MMASWWFCRMRREPQQLFLGMGFFLLFLALFPMLAGQDNHINPLHASAITWLALTMLSLLNAQGMFHEDFQSGFLEQWHLSRASMVRYVWMRVFVHWLGSVCPLLLLTPIICLMYPMPLVGGYWLFLSMLLASPSLVLMHAWVAALLLGTRQPLMLALLLVVPLLVPVLLFGSGVVLAWYAHHSLRDGFLLLFAVCLISVSCLPYATAVALRMAMTMRKTS